MNKGDDIDILARTIYGEARGENRSGKIAVANVVMNRIKFRKQAGYKIVNGHRLLSVAETCLKPFQFSCWLDSDANKKVIETVGADNAVYRECLAIASDAVRQRLVDVTYGATHYYNPQGCSCPSFAKGKTPCVIIGNHYFFNDIE